jgi:hypothetical protein
MDDQTRLGFFLKWGLQATRKIGDYIQGTFENVSDDQDFTPSQDKLAQ